MSIVATLMDKARNRRGIPTDMALGERLGRSRQVVSQWRSGDKYPDEDVIVQLAELAGDDPAQWLIAIKAIRTEGPAGKVWAALAKRLGAAAAVVLCAIGIAVSSPAKASENQGIAPRSAAADFQSMPIMFIKDASAFTPFDGCLAKVKRRCAAICLPRSGVSDRYSCFDRRRAFLINALMTVSVSLPATFTSIR